MSSSMSLLRSSMPWIAVLVPPYLLFASFSGYGVVSMSITTSVLVISAIAFTFSKQKHKILKESFQEEETTLNSHLEEHSSQVELIASHQQPQNENFGQVEDVLSAQNPRIENGVAQNENFGQVEEVLSVQNPRIENGVAQNGNSGQVEEVLSVQNPRIENGVAQNGNSGQVEELLSVQNPRIENGVAQNENSGQVKEVLSVQNPRIENGVAQNGNFGQIKKKVLSIQNPRIENGVSQIHDLYSESESLGGPSSSSSEDSDIDWPFSGELEQSPLCSDGSISDEESLIEIALPSGQFVKDSPKLSFHQQNQKVLFADLVPESIFQQHYLVDFLTDTSDVCEEDNLIEIDISMGSIKCSGFEIPA